LKAKFTHPRGLAMDRDNQNLFVAETQGIRKISIEDGTVSTIARGIETTTAKVGSSVRRGYPHGIVCHHKTGDLYVVDESVGHIRKISPVKDSSDTVQWIDTSILVSLTPPGEFQSIAIFSDTLFLVKWNSATIVLTTLDGKVIRVIGKLKQTQSAVHCMIAAGATAVYVTQNWEHNIIKISRSLEWSQQNHQHFDLEKKALIKTVALASLCSSSTSQLRKLPREILFHMLSFIDCCDMQRYHTKSVYPAQQ
jgi:DNA-binding beta-propeller fold protein YncE